MHGVDRRQQPGLRWTAAFNSECLVQMGMGFHQAGERQGSRQVPQAGSRLVGWGQCGDPAVAKGQSASSGSPLACVGQPSGSAQAGSRARLIPVSGAQEEGASSSVSSQIQNQTRRFRPRTAERDLVVASFLFRRQHAVPVLGDPVEDPGNTGAAHSLFAGEHYLHPGVL